MAERGRGLVVSVDEDRRNGERAAGNMIERLGRRVLGRDQQKQVSIPTDSVSAGWQSYGPGGGPFYRTGPRRLSQLATAYGGTNDSVTWVFACVVRIASEGAAYPYAFEDLANKAVAEPPPDLAQLILKPNQKMSYFDFAEATLTDLELLGNSYWLKDQRNGYGQPLELMRLVPEAVKIAVTYDGRERGYVYEAPGGIMIPYELDEVIHFKYPNPLDEHYGMGTVEAIARALDQEIAQSLHVTGFFQNGARISGILTVPDVLTETAFQRVKNQFMEEFAGAASAFKVLIAEGGKAGSGPDFKPITQSPNTLGVVDLRKLSKDEILSGFGVPEFLLGGAAQAGVYKMDEAQNIFMRGMNPRVKRFSERTTVDLVSLWGDLRFVVKPHENDPLSIKLENAEKALKAGGCLDESREIVGWAPLDTDESRMPLVPNNLITIKQLYDRPAEAVPVPLPPAGAAVTPQGELEPGPQPKPGGEPEVPSPDDVAEGTTEEEPAKSGGARPKGGKAATGRTWRPPALPQGFEQVKRAAGSNIPTGLFQDLADHHAAVLVAGTPVMRAGIAVFFTMQRKRVTDRLSEYGPSTRRARGGRLKSAPTQQKDALEPDSLWDTEAENQALVESYLPLVDQIGTMTVASLPGIEGGGPDWTATHPHIAQARARLAEKVTRVNDTTRAAVASTVEEGLRRGYSVVQIANGVSSENYGGVLGVFDSAVHDRAETIARTETAYAYNAASLAGYADAEVSTVEVMDGEDDEECAEANGQTWTLEEAEQNELAHPNCIRAFAPITEASSDLPAVEEADPFSGFDSAPVDDLLGRGGEAVQTYHDVYDPDAKNAMGLEAIARDRGYADTPAVLDAKSMDKLLADSTHDEWHRGVTSTAYAEAFRTGDYFAGRGVLGDGIYTGEEAQAKEFVGTSGGEVLRIAVPKTARIADYETVDAERASVRAEQIEQIEAAKAKPGASWDEITPLIAVQKLTTEDVGRFAALRGYDAITGEKLGESELVILNRSIVSVQK